MPNIMQRELLDSLVGDKGIYFETIRDDQAFDLGTKVLYLQRALSQDCQAFLQSLDRLYNPHLMGKAKQANLEFVRALKLINDLCFNNPVKYQEYGIRDALSHYFASLGSISANDFKIIIEEIINAGIVVLSEGKQEVIAAQKETRAASETHIIRQTAWRRELDLPQDQLAPASHSAHHNPAFFQGVQFRVHLIPVRIQILIQANLLTNAAAAALSQVERNRLVCTQPLISNGLMTVPEALALTGDQHLSLGHKEIFTLIQEQRLTLERAKNLSDVEHGQLVCTQPLISNELMSVLEALALTGVQHCSLGHKEIFTLIQEQRLTIDKAKNFSQVELDRLVCTQPLISKELMSVPEALELTGYQHLRLGEERIFILIQEERLTIEQAKNLTQAQVDGINLGNEEDVLQQLNQQQGFNYNQ
ncbi:MAG: hypothetical protein H0U71_03850 [Gammaproteobacteria bacterium]|nr:hypothetical protein [Gammaproteobacteria bacterium]